MDSNIDLTIAIPALNEEKNIAGCLRAIGHNFAKKIVIIDSGSTDNTKQLALSLGAGVIDFKWDGKFPKKRNWFLRNHNPGTQWILFLDADEYLNEKVKEEITHKLTTEDKAGYLLNYRIYFMGKRLRGGYPLRKLALFKVGAGEYEEVKEEKWSKLDMEVHEHPKIAGNIGLIKNKIDHFDFHGIAHYVAKHNEYSDWEAERFITAIKSEKFKDNWTWKQKLKYRFIQNPLMGIFYFTGSYIFMGGFIDGWRGLTFAILKMSYFTQVYSKIKEKYAGKI